MTHLVVGDKEYPFSTVLEAIERPPSLYLDRWKTFARALKTDTSTINKLNLDIILDKMNNRDAVEQLLREWRCRNGSNATLGQLLKMVEEECKWIDLAETLRKHVRVKAEKWNELDDRSKRFLLSRPVHILGRTKTLDEIGLVLGKDKMEAILERSLKPNTLFTQSTLSDILRTDIEHNNLPPYYVERFIAIQHELNPSIFQTRCLDIFVFQGLERRSQLSPLVQGGKTDFSGSQIQNLTVRFIILQCDDDFNILSRKTSKSIHKIAFRDNRYFWVSSVGSVKVIQSHLKEEADTISVRHIVQKTLKVFNSRPTSISAIPGMGKTTLLSQIASQVKHQYPDRYVQTISLPKLASSFSGAPKEIASASDVKRKLANYMSYNALEEDILFALMSSEGTQFELFLDAYDRVPVTHLPLLHKMLQLLLQSNNVRTFITTRTYSRENLQEALGIISWNIQPFSKEDQINFFVLFWSDALPCLPRNDKHSRVAVFAKNCVEYFQHNDLMMTDKDDDNNFTDVPFHCVMLASVFQDEAKRFALSTMKRNEVDKTLKDQLLAEMYGKLMQDLFTNLPDSKRQTIKEVHWAAAVKQLFPDWLQKLAGVLELNELEEEIHSSCHNLLAPGVIQSVNPIKFRHRSFAEYLVADFIVSTLPGNCNTADFFFNSILSSSVSDCPIDEFDFVFKLMSVISSSYDRPRNQKQYENMLVAFSMEQDPCVDKVFRQMHSVFHMINRWTSVGKNSSYRSLSRILRDKLYWPNYDIDKILKIAGVSAVDYGHPTICHFIDALLGSKAYNGRIDSVGKELAEMFKDFAESTSTYQQPCSADRFFANAAKCIRRGHVRLFKLLQTVSFYNDSIHDLKRSSWASLVITASRQDVSIFEAVSQFVESLYGMEVLQLKYEPCGWDPLYEALKRGNYDVVEHLLEKCQYNFSFDERVKACVDFSDKNSLPVINRKIEIIQLLRNSRCRDFSEKSYSLYSKYSAHKSIELDTSWAHPTLLKCLIQLQDHNGDVIFHPAPLFINHVQTFSVMEFNEIVAFLTEKQLLAPVLELDNVGSVNNYVRQYRKKLKRKTLRRIRACRKTESDCIIV